jgi:1-acyl-sn-glycerol-3-phosphate acyltransferase
MSDAFPQVRMAFLYGISHYLFRFVADIAFRGEIAGLENLPKGGGFIIASNHASHLDPALVACQLPRQVCYFARKTLWKPGIGSWWMDSVGCIPVDRDGGSDVQAMKRVLKALAEGKVLNLFPEGTRSPDGKLQSPKAGVGFMACRTAVPVVPARIFDSFKAFGRNGPICPGTPVSVVFGKPMLPADYDNPADKKERYQRASERIFAQIAALQEPQFKVI